MNIDSTSTKQTKKIQLKFLASGAVLGVYINILHSVPFMQPSEFFLIFTLIAFSAIMIPIITMIWNQKQSQTVKKICLTCKGLTISSIVFSIIYLTESLAGKFFGKNLIANFPISRLPFASFLFSIILVSIFTAGFLILKDK